MGGKLIIFGGLPGTGKTTLARAMAVRLNYFYLRVDCIEAPYAAVNPSAGEEGEGYEALISLAYENLILGHNVILDSVNPLHLSRTMFKELTEKSEAETIRFELKLKDLAVHRSRIENRQSDLEGLKLPTWDNVLNREYESWDEEQDGKRYEIWTDHMDEALDLCLKIAEG